MAHGTTDPTEKYLEATATPISPLCGSMATMENVETGGSVCATAAPLAKKTKVNNNKYFFINSLHFVSVWQDTRPSALTLSVLTSSSALVLRDLCVLAVKFKPVCPARRPAPQSPVHQTTPEHT